MNPNQKNSYGMTPFEVAIQFGESNHVKEIAAHPDFDYKQQRASKFLQILEHYNEYGKEVEIKQTKQVLYEVIAAQIEKDPKNLGHYTPTFIRDDLTIVTNAVKKDPSVLEHASIRLREDPMMQLLQSEQISNKNMAIANMKTCRESFNKPSIEAQPLRSNKSYL